MSLAAAFARCFAFPGRAITAPAALPVHCRAAEGHGARARALALAFLVLGAAGTARAEELSSRAALVRNQLRAAVTDQETWLGGGANARAWQTFLLSDTLHHELEATGLPDVIALDEVLARYEDSNPGLARPPMQRVRRSLSQWIEVLPRPSAGQLAELARATAQQALPNLDAASRSSREALLRELTRLETALAALGSERVAWRVHLRCDELATTLATDPAPNPRDFDSIRNRYQSGHRGLDSQPVQAVRQGLERHAQALRAAGLASPEKALADCLHRLARNLERLETRRSSKTLREIAECLAWCDEHGLAPQVVRAVRRQYVRPNLLVQASGEALLGSLAQEFDEVLPVRDVMSGAQITGSARLTGRLSMELVPRDDQAAIDLTFRGEVRSQTVGRSGPVTFSGHGRTKLEGRKSLVADAQQVRGLPAVASAQSDLSVDQLWSRFALPLIDRVACRVGWREVDASREANERHVNGRAAGDLRRRIDDQASDLVESLNDALAEQLRVPLAQHGIYPDDVRLSTTERHLRVEATQAGPGQLAAMNEPPSLDPEAGLALAIHESALNNTANTTLAGRTLASHELTAALEPILGTSLSSFETVDGVPWSLTAAPTDPVEVRFAGDELKITIRCTRIKAGAEDINIPFAVSARYRSRLEGPAVVFTRQAELEVSSPALDSAPKLSDGVTDPATEVREQFSIVLQEELRFTADQLPVAVPGIESWVPRRLVMQEGWACLELDPAPVAQAETLVAASAGSPLSKVQP